MYTNFRTKQELFLGCLDRVCAILGDLSSAESSAGEVDVVPGRADALSRQEPKPEVLASFLLQAVAALRAEPLRASTLLKLTGLRDLIGAEAFDRLLVRGGDSLLEGAANPSLDS